MPAASVRTFGADLVAWVRAWWDGSSFVGDVALVFTIVTVGNSVMMLTGLDEPKTGSFAYVHLLGRLGIITLLVGLFHLDELRERLTRRAHQLRHSDPPDDPHSSPRRGLEDVLNSVLRGGLDGTARVYTAVVAATCLVALALGGIWPPEGGRGLYRILVLLALLLLPVMLVASRWWQHRTSRGGSRSA